jgi:ABC-type polysaccharide/polyol phosphate export permease
MTVLGPEIPTTAQERPAATLPEQGSVEDGFDSFSALSSASGRQPNNAVIAPAKQSFLGFTLRTLNELRFVKFALASFVINNLRRRYQRSFLGFAWSLLNPLLMMVVLTAVFSILFHRDPRTFSIYVFTGMLPWTFISESITIGSLSITTAEGFMKKVYIPKIFFPLVAVSTEAINFCLSLVSMMSLALFVGLQLHWTLLLLPAAMILTYFYTFGIVLALAVATVYFRDLTHLVRVMLQSFFYLIPIVYPVSAVPEKYAIFFLANPFSQFINLYRQIIFNGQVPSLQEWAAPAALTVASLMIGFYVLMKREKDIIFRL